MAAPHDPHGVEQVLSYARFLRLARPLAYSNEVGESFRNVIPKLVPAAYGLTFLYVGADIAHRVSSAPSDDRAKELADAAAFHSVASLAGPTAAVYGVVHTAKAVLRSSSPRVRAVGPVLAGLSSIPFIIQPIDHWTERMMNRYLRPHIWGERAEVSKQ